MESSVPSESRNKFLKTKEEEYQKSEATETNCQDIIKTFPTTTGWLPYYHLHFYEGFWFRARFLPGIISAQQHFTAQPSDIVLCSPPKSGTTWLKALAFAVVTRTQFGNIFKCSPLLTKLPHDCVPSLELDLSKGQPRNNPELPLLATHIPYESLPKSIIDSKCKIVYIYRDPKDAFISHWHFIRKFPPMVEGKTLQLHDAFQMFCKGISSFGPYWDHVLGYMKARVESPDNILVLKYEDLMIDTVRYVKKMAEFMGCSFTLEEEKEGVVNEIVEFCSFEKLSNLDVNKNGRHRATNESPGHENNKYFRKGKVGDWKNYLTAEMGKELDEIVQQKFSNWGLTF